MKYLISWKGYGPEYNSWEPEKTLKQHAQDALNEYWDEVAAVQAAQSELGWPLVLALPDLHLAKAIPQAAQVADEVEVAQVSGLLAKGSKPSLSHFELGHQGS